MIDEPELTEILKSVWSKESLDLLIFYTGSKEFELVRFFSMRSLVAKLKINSTLHSSVDSILDTGICVVFGHVDSSAFTEASTYFFGNHAIEVEYGYTPEPDVSKLTSAIQETQTLLRTYPLSLYP